MSLKVWLPLNGDLKNLGTSNAIITNSSASVNTTGKIGSCYSFAKNAYLDINKEIMRNFNNAVSICFWIKINSWNTNWDTIFQAGKGSTAWTQYHIGILRNSANYLCWTLGDGSTASNANYRTGNITLGEWTHVTCTYGEGKWATYLNGILSNSGTTTIIPNFSNITSIKIGGLAGAYKCDCLMNDFRIYDHALSAAEVHEIAQGLVLHYKLDKKYLISGTNLVTGITQGGQTTKLTDGRIGVITSGSNADTYFTVNLSENITNGTTYTLTCNASGISDGAYWGFPLGQQSNSTLLFKIYNGYNEYTFTANDINWGTKRLFLDDANRTDWANRATFWDFQLYKNGSFGVEDSSGYGYNGEIISELHISNDSARYKNSTLFDGVDDCIIVPYNTVCPENIFTINLWFKKDALGSKNYETLFGGPGGFEMDTRAGSATSLSLYMASTRSGNRATGITMNEWHMITMTRDGTTEKYYVDGEFKSEIEAKPMPNGVYRIGAWASNTGQNYYGLISDFRIYATALLDTDIKKLYNTSMSIDNNQNIHVFESNENGVNKLTKSGILYDGITESYLTLPDGSDWKLLLYHYVDHGNNLFTSSNATYCNDFGLYSRLQDINKYMYDGKYEFYVIQDGTEYRWTQTSQPTASSIAGLTTVSGYADPVNGLAKANQSNTYIGYGSWWGACGCWTKYSTGGKTGIPGFGPHDAQGICEKYLALYVRIPSNKNTKLKDSFAEANELIER